MIQIKNLTITHKKDLRVILRDFSFTLNNGDKAVIIGEEGNGKSTLLKLIYNEELIEDYAEYTGEIIRQQQRIGYLAQELPTEELQLSVYEFCMKVPDFLEKTPKELADISGWLGLKNTFYYSEQQVSTLSGGEKVKLQVARILMLQPDVLLLDEPSNDIDIETLEWLERFINNCQLPILYVSHDELLIENTANIIIHIEQIMRKTEAIYTIAKLPYRKYIEERTCRLTTQEQEARNERRDYDKQQEKFRRIEQKVEHQQNSVSRQDPHSGRLLKKKMKAVKSMERRFDKEFENMTQEPDTEEAIFVKFGEDSRLPNGKRILELDVKELVRPSGIRDSLLAGKGSKDKTEYTIGQQLEDKVNESPNHDFTEEEITRDKIILARNICLRVMGGEKIGIIGRNGVGKSTLIKMIAAELLPRTDLKTSYMPQNYEDLLTDTITPVEYLAKTGDKEEVTKIRTYLGSMKYTSDEMLHPIAELSGGQKAKLLFLKMSIDGSNVLILDEPTRNFSPLSNPVIREVLKAYEGVIISISHDRKYIREVCGKVYELTEEGLRETEV